MDHFEFKKSQFFISELTLEKSQRKIFEAKRILRLNFIKIRKTSKAQKEK